jgi:hypothetical protein
MFKSAYHFTKIELLIYNKQKFTHFQLKSKYSSREQKEFDWTNLFRTRLNCLTSYDNSLTVNGRWLYVLIPE